MSIRIRFPRFFFRFLAIGAAVVTAAVIAYFFRYQTSIKIEREVVVANVGLMKALIPMESSFVIVGEGETSAFAMHINAWAKGFGHSKKLTIVQLGKSSKICVRSSLGQNASIGHEYDISIPRWHVFYADEGI